MRWGFLALLVAFAWLYLARHRYDPLGTTERTMRFSKSKYPKRWVSAVRPRIPSARELQRQRSAER